ncbi:MAG: hypothetical protein ABIK20_06975 [Candidatus Omnitrophota bacterium]
MNPKKNISLIVGIAIPVLMIFLVAVSIYLPALFAPAPRFNFLYVTGGDYDQNRQYVVENGVLKYLKDTPGGARFFVHDVSSNESKEVSFKEVRKLKLDANAKSPDGYEVICGSAEGLFPFDYSNYDEVYLKGHHASKKLNLQYPAADYRYYRNRTRFLGWIR